MKSTIAKIGCLLMLVATTAQADRYAETDYECAHAKYVRCAVLRRTGVPTNLLIFTPPAPADDQAHEEMRHELRVLARDFYAVGGVDVGQRKRKDGMLYERSCSPTGCLGWSPVPADAVDAFAEWTKIQG